MRSGKLKRIPAAQVKATSWTTLRRSVRKQHGLLIIYRNQPDAVVLDIQTYTRLLNAVGQASQVRKSDSLEALRQRFDQRLAQMREEQRLEKVLAQPALQGIKVKLGPAL